VIPPGEEESSSEQEPESEEDASSTEESEGAGKAKTILATTRKPSMRTRETKMALLFIIVKYAPPCLCTCKASHFGGRGRVTT
jgi:hypothetical protein